MNPDTETIVRKPNKFHIMAIFIGLLVALPLGSFLFFNSQSFFARASDELPRDVIVSDITKSSATIVWTTDKETQAVVEYGLSPEELTLFSPELSAKQDHSVDLTLLTPSTTYYFQIRIGGTVYDNAGVPWTFTTHSISGEDARDRVKGVSTQITPRITKKPENSTDSASLSNIKCTASDCDTVKGLLGKGCSARDYVQCLAGNKSSTPSATSSTQVYSTPYPAPTTVHIVSDWCKVKFLQPINTCLSWRWDSLQQKPSVCQDAFDRYIFQCRNLSFSSSTSSGLERFYEGAFTDIASTSATLWSTPSSGTTVYCRLRAVDAEGSDEGDSHGTAWVYSEKRCD